MALRIGVIGNRDRVQYKVQDLYKELDREIVKDVIFGKSYSRIYLKDGSSIESVFVNSKARGHKFDLVYVDLDLEGTDEYYEVVLPSLESSKLKEIINADDIRYAIRWF